MNINSQCPNLIKEIANQVFCSSVSELLDNIKEQTLYKISFIKQYMELATLVHIHRPVIENIVFIDSMCNAGIYQNGYLCSAMEILLVFQDIIKAYNPTLKFHMILNDRNSARIDSTK